jgi:hypothetical protein
MGLYHDDPVHTCQVCGVSSDGAAAGVLGEVPVCDGCAEGLRFRRTEIIQAIVEVLRS